jgi:hypothetical protein
VPLRPNVHKSSLFSESLDRSIQTRVTTATLRAVDYWVPRRAPCAPAAPPLLLWPRPLACRVPRPLPSHHAADFSSRRDAQGGLDNYLVKTSPDKLRGLGIELRDRVQRARAAGRAAEEFKRANPAEYQATLERQLDLRERSAFDENDAPAAEPATDIVELEDADRIEGPLLAAAAKPGSIRDA